MPPRPKATGTAAQNDAIFLLLHAPQENGPVCSAQKKQARTHSEVPPTRQPPPISRPAKTATHKVPALTNRPPQTRVHKLFCALQPLLGHHHRYRPANCLTTTATTTTSTTPSPPNVHTYCTAPPSSTAPPLAPQQASRSPVGRRRTPPRCCDRRRETKTSETTRVVPRRRSSRMDRWRRMDPPPGSRASFRARSCRPRCPY